MTGLAMHICLFGMQFLQAEACPLGRVVQCTDCLVICRTHKVLFPSNTVMNLLQDLGHALLHSLQITFLLLQLRQVSPLSFLIALHLPCALPRLHDLCTNLNHAFTLWLSCC